MRFFNPDNHSLTDEHKRIYALCEVAYTTVDFLAAALFVMGSFLFFNESTATAGTWMFVVGSVFFGLRPTIKLYREIRYLQMGDFDDIVKG